MKASSKSGRLFKGKGFYIALVVSVAAIGGAAWIGMSSAMRSLENETPVVPEIVKEQSQNEWTVPDSVEAEKKQSGVQAPAETPESKDTAVVQGYILPISGEILNEYSGDKMVKSKTLDDWVMHTGTDIAADVATPVKAMSGGVVTSITKDNMWGTTVAVSHSNGLTSYYSNLSDAVSVKANQNVKMGDVLGVIGDTCDIERAEPSHLHFGVKQNGSWVDPLSVIK